MADLSPIFCFLAYREDTGLYLVSVAPSTRTATWSPRAEDGLRSTAPGLKALIEIMGMPLRAEKVAR